VHCPVYDQGAVMVDRLPCMDVMYWPSEVQCWSILCGYI